MSRENRTEERKNRTNLATQGWNLAADGGRGNAPGAGATICPREPPAERSGKGCAWLQRDSRHTAREPRSPAAPRAAPLSAAKSVPAARRALRLRSARASVPPPPSARFPPPARPLPVLQISFYFYDTFYSRCFFSAFPPLPPRITAGSRGAALAAQPQVPLPHRPVPGAAGVMYARLAAGRQAGRDTGPR